MLCAIDRVAIFFAPVVFNALTTRAPGAQFATCSPPDVVWPIAKPRKPGARGLVQSMRIFPDRFPATYSASCVAAHGVARRTPAAVATASAILLAQAFAPALRNTSCTLAPCGWRTPNKTSCPFCAQRWPNVPPTFPAPSSRGITTPAGALRVYTPSWMPYTPCRNERRYV